MNGYLGIDVSKGYADFTLLDTNKKQLEEVFQLDDTREGHDSLKQQIISMMRIHGLEQLYCGVESTGGFENNWYHDMQQWSQTLPVHVVRLNPSVVKSNTAASLQRNVTDALSSRYIAEYLASQFTSIDWSTSSSYYSSFRSLNNHINLQKRQGTQLINEMKAVLYSAFPELLRYCKGSIPQWVLEVLCKYPSAKLIASLKPHQLCKIKHVDESKAVSLIQKAKNTVASRTNTTDEYLIRQLAIDISSKQITIKQQKEFLATQCKGEEIELLTSVIGIGKYSACVAMIEIEDIKRFDSPKKLVSYFGVHPELKDSGDKKPVYRMSKRGRCSLREALYMCAHTAVNFDEHIKKIYHRHREKGFTHKQAIGVIMHKLLRIMWGILTHKTSYNSKIDQENQNKHPKHPSEKRLAEMKSKRRFQRLDSEAPISRRQTVTRKAHFESQVSNAEPVRDLQKAP